MITRYRIIYIFVLVLLCGCKTASSPTIVEQVRTEIACRDRVARDTTYIHTADTLRERGDTIVQVRWRTEYRERVLLVTDTIVRTDTIPQPYQVTEYVEKRLGAVHRFFIVLGIGALAYGIIRTTKHIVIIGSSMGK